MAYTATALAPYKTGWAVFAYSDDLSGCEELRAAPGTGLYLRLDAIQITAQALAATRTITIGAGESGPGSVASVLIGPLAIAAGTRAYSITFTRPLLLPVNTSLTVDASAGGTFSIYAAGETV